MLEPIAFCGVVSQFFRGRAVSVALRRAKGRERGGFCALKNPCASRLHFISARQAVSIPPSLLASARQAVVKFPA